LFLLAVFVFAAPLFHLGMFSGSLTASYDTLTMPDLLGRDNWLRIFALISLGAFALFNLLRSKPGRFHINGLLGWLILFYLVWAALSIIWSIDPRFTLKRVAILLLLSLGALYVADRFSLQETIALVLFICAVGILGGLVFVIKSHTFHPFSNVWRFGGNMDPVSQGWHCGLLLMSAFALSKTTEKNRAVYLGTAFIAFLLLILTRSRMPFVACIMGSAVYWGLTPSKRYQAVLFFLGIIIFGCLMYFLLGYEFRGFSENVFSLNRLGGMETLSTFTGRIPVWENIMKLVYLRPFAGYGYDTSLTSQNLIWMTEKIGWATPSPHSGYMSTLAGLGVTGAVTLVLILFLSVKMSIGLAKRNSEYAFITAVLVWLIINLVTEDQILTRPYFAIFVWMIMLARLGFIREKSRRTME
jgi:O-antigen ligase